VWNWLVGWLDCIWPVLSMRQRSRSIRNRTITESHRAGSVLAKPYSCMPGIYRLESQPSYELSRCNLWFSSAPQNKFQYNTL